jgi:hypothetical protein
MHQLKILKINLNARRNLLHVAAQSRLLLPISLAIAHSDPLPLPTSFERRYVLYKI